MSYFQVSIGMIYEDPHYEYTLKNHGVFQVMNSIIVLNILYGETCLKYLFDYEYYDDYDDDDPDDLDDEDDQEYDDGLDSVY